jgi:RNA polymerase sigma-70 factor (ECF subfamily)
MKARPQTKIPTPLRFSERQDRLRTIIDDHVRFVTRTLRKAGVPVSELDDEVQHTFIIAARRLDDVERGAERNFLYQVALNIAAHARRKLARRREVLNNRVPERIETLATPEQLTSRKEIRELLDGAAARMGKALYEVFTLFAFEGVNLTEIAKRLGVPRGTVASRLRRARVQFRKHAAAIELAWDLDSAGGHQLDEPEVLRREILSELMRALLLAGSSTGTAASMRIETLAALGLNPRPPAVPEREHSIAHRR